MVILYIFGSFLVLFSCSKEATVLTFLSVLNVMSDDMLSLAAYQVFPLVCSFYVIRSYLELSV